VGRGDDTITVSIAHLFKQAEHHLGKSQSLLFAIVSSVLVLLVKERHGFLMSCK
jgi:hypothetical protein